MVNAVDRFGGTPLEDAMRHNKQGAGGACACAFVRMRVPLCVHIHLHSVKVLP